MAPMPSQWLQRVPSPQMHPPPFRSFVAYWRQDEPASGLTLEPLVRSVVAWGLVAAVGVVVRPPLVRLLVVPDELVLGPPVALLARLRYRGGLLEIQVQGYLAHKKLRPPLRSPSGPRHSPTVGFYGGALSYERGPPVRLELVAFRI